MRKPKCEFDNNFASVLEPCKWKAQGNIVKDVAKNVRRALERKEDPATLPRGVERGSQEGGDLPDAMLVR